ncbi:MAG: VOC family protein [Thermoplasmata archaeon]|nr:VOC family protein [Thermoplasmata archaeon]
MALVVADRKRAVTGYTRNFGLDVIEQGTGPGAPWVVVGRKGQNGGVHQCDIPTFDPACSVEPGNSGIQLDLRGDFQAACAALEKNGVRFLVPRRKRSWGWEA